jgi:hypothetical protein
VVSGCRAGVWDLGFWDFWGFGRDLDLERLEWWGFLKGFVGCRWTSPSSWELKDLDPILNFWVLVLVEIG